MLFMYDARENVHSMSKGTHIVPKYLDNIVEIFLENIVTILLCPHRI